MLARSSSGTASSAGLEPCSDGMRALIEGTFGIRVTDNYVLAQVMGPGVAGECAAVSGLHVNEDHLLVEIVDPELRIAGPARRARRARHPRR